MRPKISNPHKRYQKYLQEKLQIKEKGIFIGNERIVAYGQERIMELYAEIVINKKRSPRILEVGFGGGLFAKALEKYKVKEHIIVDCHPQVCSLAEEMFGKEKHIKIIQKFWQDLNCDIGKFDGVFYDVSVINGNALEELLDFIDYAFQRLLVCNGVFSFWYCSKKIHIQIIERLNYNNAECEISLNSIDSEKWDLPCKEFIMFKAIKK